MLSMKTDLPKSNCPNCGHTLDASAGLDGVLPEPGDITVCVYCGHICAYDDDLRLRDLNEQEAYDVAGDPGVLGAVKIAGWLREQMKEKETENGKE